MGNGAIVFLVVEDSAEDAFLIGRAFAKLERCVARVCRNTEEAKAYLQGLGDYANRHAFPFPAVVMSDLNLGMDSGLDLFRWLRGRREFDSVSAVLLTGSAFPQHLQAAAEMPDVQVVQKPTDLVELRRIVDDLCQEAVGRS